MRDEIRASLILSVTAPLKTGVTAELFGFDRVMSVWQSRIRAGNGCSTFSSQSNSPAMNAQGNNEEIGFQQEEGLLYPFNDCPKRTDLTTGKKLGSQRYQLK